MERSWAGLTFGTKTAVDEVLSSTPDGALPELYSGANSGHTGGIAVKVGYGHPRGTLKSREGTTRRAQAWRSKSPKREKGRA